MAFPFLHPAARILLWLLLAVFLQVAALPVLALAGACLLLAGEKMRQHWWRLFLRTRILLLVLFLVFAYGVPGESPNGILWLPTFEGMAEAALHVLRLVVFLGSLAWLLAPLSHQALMGGLWFLLQPCRYLGLPVDKSVVRLSLVLEYMENLPAQSWRQWLTPTDVPQNPAPVQVSLPLWRGRDVLALLFAVLLLAAGVWS
jgi:energy-coupling factor transporter transmembrane protein EcfT